MNAYTVQKNMGGGARAHTHTLKQFPILHRHTVVLSGRPLWRQLVRTLGGHHALLRPLGARQPTTVGAQQSRVRLAQTDALAVDHEPVGHLGVVQSEPDQHPSGIGLRASGPRADAVELAAVVDV